MPLDWSTAPADAAAHFAHRLAVEIDVSDVHAGLESGAPAFVLLDSRSAESWAQGHVPGAVHLPGRDFAARAAAELDRSVPVVTSCWGPGCNGATRAALALALLGVRVRVRVRVWVRVWVRSGSGPGTGHARALPCSPPLASPVRRSTCSPPPPRSAAAAEPAQPATGAGSSDSRDHSSSSCFTPSPYR
ncbi:Rhodanese-related sulfurtransferase [Modestobacter sp. DSM 44400]|uniref:rhodanese-like domain-containing protein n=1 Tax=Modestobacter sp. DSM 44400 TaxID=1550230 RepID=UPI0008967E10|nr:rhodanese-like domain-containing protein [Modestobacter sp. DSM 44400]SDY90285.1 Rhodanese-related sulfurtransferase [Modestobacter sp. DSM 44400]